MVHELPIYPLPTEALKAVRPQAPLPQLLDRPALQPAHRRALIPVLR